MGCQPYSFLGRRDCGQDRSMAHPSYKQAAVLKLLRRGSPSIWVENEHEDLGTGMI